MDELLEFIGSWHLPFELVTVTGGKTLWLDTAHWHKKLAVASSLTSSHLEATVATNFCVCLPAFHTGSSPASNSTVPALAERYGGSGLGPHGGGARSAVVGDYVIKGVGANDLLGASSDEEHTYGGLDIHCAISEIVHTALVDQLLPYGAVQTRALILLDTSLGRYRGKSCWAVLLLRDNALRPAHFLRAPNFTPKAAVTRRISHDERRVRAIHKQFQRRFGDTVFIAMIRQFLLRSAAQFAAARYARLLHGSLSESNIALDGRWLDVPLATFTVSGHNFSQASDFLSEPFSPPTYARQLIYLYNKYNHSSIDPKPLEAEYSSELNRQSLLHAGYLLGFDPEDVQVFAAHPAWLVLVKLVESLIRGSNPERDWSYALFEQVDRLNQVIRQAYSSLNSFFRDGQLPQAESDEVRMIVQRLPGLLQELYRVRYKEDKNLASFFRRVAITALKRCQLCAVFFLPKIDEAIMNFCLQKRPEVVEDFIEFYQRFCCWAYAKNLPGDSVIVIEDQKLTVLYNAGLDQYQVQRNGENYSIKKYAEVYAKMPLATRDKTLASFRLGDYLDELAEVLA